MRYVLAAIFICAAGMPAASAQPAAGANLVSVSKADPTAQAAKRNRPPANQPRAHARSQTLLTVKKETAASTLWLEAATIKPEET